MGSSTRELFGYGSALSASLQGQTVLITGVCSAVGEELAIEFGRRGANLVLFDQRVPSSIRERLKGLNVGEDQLLTMTGDFRNEKTRENIVEKALEKFNKIHYLVNVVYQKERESECTTTSSDLSTELRGLVPLENLVHPHLRKSHGKLVNILASVRLNEEQEMLYSGFCAELSEKCAGKGGLECFQFSAASLQVDNVNTSAQEMAEYIFYVISGKAKYAKLAAHCLLAFPLLIFAVFLLLWGPIPQPASYHDYADKRVLLDHLPYTANVISSFGFSLVGIFGLFALIMARTTKGWPNARFVHPMEFHVYQLFFALLIAMGLGTAFYNAKPENATLLWERLPVAAALAILVTAFIVERISPKVGIFVAIPLLLASIAGTLHWYFSEQYGHSDLRLYLFVVQGFSFVLMPVLLFAYPSPFKGTGLLVAAFILFAFSRIAEGTDRAIFDLSAHIIAGHTLKNLLATLATCLICAYVLCRERRKNAQMTFHLNGLRWAKKIFGKREKTKKLLEHAKANE